MESLDFNTSRIKRAEFDNDSLELTIEFAKGGTYKYRDVDYNTWLGFVGATSPGRFFDSNIKGKFDYMKI